MCVQLVDNDSPLRIRMHVDRPLAVFQKIEFGSCRTQRWGKGFSGHDMERGDQTQGAMPDVLEFDPFFQAGSHRFFLAIRSSAWTLVISSMQTVCVSN